MPGKPRNLRLIQGGLHYEVTAGSLKIVAAPESSPPFHVDAMVCEEDTWLIMSEDPKIVDPNIHPIKLMNDIMKIKPKPVGSVVVRNGRPRKFLAIIHDVDQDPTWKVEWIDSALDAVLIEAEKQNMHAIGIPLLGCRHGSFKTNLFLALLRSKTLQRTFHFIHRLWIITKKENHCDIVDAMDEVFN